ncbi:hypothetical protein [Salinimicrobium terrae]|uniref:hypothetical protein n=1 Tax=Salinimicrobium terrae TaxID=470866 RepID=UPI0003FF7EA4|nr:hypothetical protein [Salinimicrobium terrae]
MFSPNSLKKYYFFFLLFFTINNIKAQFSINNPIYFTSELTAGNYLGVDIHFNYLLNEEYSFKMGYSGHLREPKSAPYNYSPGFFGILSFGLKNPFDKLGNYHVMAGRIYNLNKKGTIRANISLGLGLAVIKEPTNWQILERGLLYQNYTFDYNKYYTLGLILNPKIEFPFTKYFGLTLSPMLQINKDRTYIGIGIGHMIGPLRREAPEEDL